MKKYLIIIFAISFVLSACSAKKENSSASLLGSWNLTSYGPANEQTPAVADAKANLTFKEDGTVTGNSGCNGFSGSYKVKNDNVTFGQIVSTLMACGDPRMKQEDAVHRVLADTANFKIDGNTLTLTNNDMVLLLTR